MIKQEKKLYKAYEKRLGSALQYFAVDDARYNLDVIVGQLQFLRDYKILQSEDPEHDQVINTIHNAITEYAKYSIVQDKLATGLNYTPEQLRALCTEKDTHYRQFWELLSHNFEGWFE